MPTSEQIFGNKQLKRKLVISAKAVKAKVKALKDDKSLFSESLERTFEPITKPLNTLLTENKLTPPPPPPISKIKKEKKKEESFNSSENIETSGDESDVDSSFVSTESTTPKRGREKNVDDSEEVITTKKEMIDKYIEEREKERSHDKPQYGIIYLKPDEENKNKLKVHLGNHQIEFYDNFESVKISDEMYETTAGLLALLFSKHPNKKLITTQDRENYGKILNSTNAHRRNFSSKGQLVGDRSDKYKLYIKRNKEKRGKGISLTLKTLQHRPTTDYVYWDDPNELVNRLRLLIASQNAGNSNHDNEIISIIEELTEAGIIYK